MTKVHKHHCLVINLYQLCSMWNEQITQNHSFNSKFTVKHGSASSPSILQSSIIPILTILNGQAKNSPYPLWHNPTKSSLDVPFARFPKSQSLHLHTLSTSFVRWQMSRLVSDFIPVHPHHWSSAAPDCLPSVTELFRSPLLASGTVCLILSLPHLP